MTRHIILFCLLISLASTELLHYCSYNQDPKEIKKIFKFEDDDSVMRVKGKDHQWTPVQAGKALAFMAQDTWANIKVGGEDGQLTIHYQQPWDSQFIAFNFGFPFPAPFGSTYLNPPPPNSGIFPTATVIYGKGANPYSVFQQASSEFSDQNGESVYGIFPVFLVNLVFPAEVQGLHALRILEARQTVVDMNLDAEKESVLQSQILGFYDIFFGRYNVIYDEEIKLKYDDILPSLSDPYFYPIDLACGDVLYASTDETFHFWLGDDATKAYLVDGGSLYLANGLSGLIQNHYTVETIFITLTHFHIEHIQSLTGFIVNSPDQDIILVLAASLSMEFAGWYLQHYQRLAPLIQSGSLIIQIVDEDVWVPFGEYDLLILMTHLFEDNRIKHFIPNASPVVRDASGRYRIFGGDLQSNSFNEFGVPVILPNDVTLEALESWLNTAFEIAGIPTSAPIDFYFFIGLFFFNIGFYYFQEGNPAFMTPDFVIDNMKQSVSDYSNLDIISCHIKDEHGFNMERHESFGLS